MDRIGLHMKAKILEDMGDKEAALSVWREAAELAINWYAERQVARLASQLGEQVPMDTVYIENGGPSLRPPTRGVPRGTIPN